jgi:hypothetical protein
MNHRHASSAGTFAACALLVTLGAAASAAGAAGAPSPATPAADLLALDRDARGRVTGLTLNPGPWPIRARRLPGH